jgi:hypothetical protein
MSDQKMGKLSQAGIAISALGGVIALTGLFPSVIGLEQASGIGILQILVILAGFSILIFGAFIFVQSAYYAGIRHNLAQQIALRASMTGLIIAAASGLSDVLGFGSHPVGIDAERPLLGTWQATGVLGGFLIAAIGVLIFALMGHSEHPAESTVDNNMPEQTAVPIEKASG